MAVKLTRRHAALGLGAAACAAPFAFRKVGCRDDYASAIEDAGNSMPPLPVKLAAGFQYQVLQVAGQEMSDRRPVPPRPDGMACFEGARGELVLMRNHENPDGNGGVTQLRLDGATLTVKHSQWALEGTDLNCAGGLSPWGWLTCEESEAHGHGFVYACPIGGVSHARRAQRRAPDPRASQPFRIRSYGRFRHEAATVDPTTQVAYLTEDQGDGCFYRFLPDDPARPFQGRLQALALGPRSVDTQKGFQAHHTWKGRWVDVPAAAQEDGKLRHRALEAGAAKICRGEGLWLGQQSAFFSATAGGNNGGGQIFRVSLDRETPRVELFAESTDRAKLDMPDNITIAPWGDLYVAEDGYGLMERVDCIRVVSASGSTRTILECRGSEIAGLCFSPKGDVLFANLQGLGATVAIRGPFRGAAPS